MSSQPPDKPLPFGLPPLKWDEFKKVVSEENSIAATDPLSTLTSPSSSSAIAITPIASSDVALTPDSKHSFFPLSPRGFFSKDSSRTVTDEPPSRPRRIFGENKKSSTPISSPIFSSSSSSSGGSTSSSSSGGSTTFLGTLHLRNHQKKELKPKNELTISDFEEDVKTQYYPLGYKGSLETYEGESKFNEWVRDVLGMNSFADGTSTNLFSLELMELDLKKVIISTVGKIRISNIVKIVTKKKLLDGLYLYDRNMSFWLEGQDGYELYVKYMQLIFSDKKERDVRTVFGAIQKYSQLDKRIKRVVEEEKYNKVYENIISLLKEYKRVFPKKFQIKGVEISFLSREKVTEKEVIRIKGKEKKEIRSPAEMKLHVEEIFSQEFNLDDKFFQEFIRLQNENYGKVPDVITEFLPGFPPKLNLKSLHKEEVLNVFNYFFSSLCRWNPKFYEARHVSGKEDVFINKDFSSVLMEIEQVEDFIFLLKEQKKLYDQSLLKIVFQKSLEYIQGNMQVEIDCSQVIDEILEKYKETLVNACQENFYTHGELFFNIIIDDVFEKIESSLSKSSEQILEYPSGPPGLAPRG